MELLWAYPCRSRCLAPKAAKSPAAHPQKDRTAALPESALLPVSEALSQRVVEYHIDVQLEPDTGTLRALKR
jgi:hypothetical protein